MTADPTAPPPDALDALLARRRAGRRELPDPAMRRHLRERAGLSQTDVARVLGVTQAAVNRWESGQRNPRGDLRAQYGDVLDRLARAS